MVLRIDLEDNKYTYLFDDETGEQKVLRYGEAWRDLVGDQFVYAMAMRIVELQTKLQNKEEGE